MAEENKTVERRSRRKKSHPWAFPLGLLILVLAAVGIISLILWGASGIRNLTNDNKVKEEYQAFLTPVVMYDPDPFDDLSQAKMDQLLDASIWAVLRSNLAPDQYVSDGSSLQIPQADVEKQFTRLFGTQLKPSHMTVSGYGYQFSYDEAGQLYRIPLTGVEPAYTPRVEKIQKKGSTTVLTVGYISSGQWRQDEQGNMVPVQADKYMKVTLREGKDGGYYISAMQATDAPETAKADAAATLPVTETETQTTAAETAPAEETLPPVQEGEPAA